MKDLTRLTITIALSVLSLTPGASTSAANFEWVTVRPLSDGNALAITALQPLAGTPIRRDRPVTFTLTINYVLESAPKGLIALVIQDEHTHRLVPDHPQLKHEIVKGSGTVTLTDTMTIKHYAKMAEMFVLLLPEGAKSANEGVILRWPIVRPK